jgi:hypothetical protein
LEYRRKRYAENAQKQREYARKYREENPERVREWSRKSVNKWRAANPEKSRESWTKSNHKWRVTNLEKARESHKNWYRANQEKEQERSRKYYYTNQEKEKKRGREYQRKRFAKNPEKIRNYFREYHQKRRKTIPEIYMMRSCVHRMLKVAQFTRTSRNWKYICCTPQFLRNHLEEQFLPGMTWENYGEWHVDHIIPLSIFPFKEMPELLFVASHWTNLRPLWRKENLSKGKRYAA